MQELTNVQRPRMPSLQDSLQSLVKTQFRNFTDCPGYWKEPDFITPTARQAALDYLNAVRMAYPAPNEDWLKGRIATLLSHYFHSTEDGSINAMVAADWIDSLSIVPGECIAKACTEWRDTRTQKPKPADIRKLAIQHFGETEWEKIMRLKELCGLPVGQQNKNDASDGIVFVRPSNPQKQQVAEIMHNAGLPHSDEHCVKCQGTQDET